MTNDKTVRCPECERPQGVTAEDYLNVNYCAKRMTTTFRPVVDDCAAHAKAKADAQQAVRIGSYGAAYDGPDVCCAYTYKHQPGNAIASRLGRAAKRAAEEPYGDYIDLGLQLLKLLESDSFGVFDLKAVPAEGQRAPGMWLLQVKPSFQQGRGKYERAEHRGYTDDILHAGRFTEEWAKKCAADCPEKLEAIPDPYSGAASMEGQRVEEPLTAEDIDELLRIADPAKPTNLWQCDTLDLLRFAQAAQHIGGPASIAEGFVAVKRDSVNAAADGLEYWASGGKCENPGAEMALVHSLRASADSGREA